MRTHISSSWNPDRMAGSMLSKKRKPRVVKPTSTLKSYKASELYMDLYGREAYEAWKAREAEIDELMKDREKYPIASIVFLRKQNFCAMKDAGERRDRMMAAIEMPNAEITKAA